MKKRRRFAITVVVLVCLCGGTVFVAARDVRQARLNHELIEAIKQEDAKRAIVALHSGADANALDVPLDKRSLYQRCRDLLLHRNPAADAKLNNALALAFYKPSNSTGQMTNWEFAHAAAIALLQSGADANTHAHFGASFGNISIPVLCQALEDLTLTRSFVEHGCDVNMKIDTGIGVSRFMLCSAENSPEVFQYLLEHHADPNQRDEFRGTPLFEIRNSACIRLLVQYGADPNAADINGNTPLLNVIMCMGRDSWSGTPRVLVEIGANPYLRNKTGENAFDVLHHMSKRGFFPAETYAKFRRILQQYKGTK